MKTLAIVIICLLGLSFSVVAQNDSVYIEEFIQEETQRNISAYNIRYGDPTINGIILSNFLNSSTNFFYDAFLPKKGFRIKMDIEKLNWNYPIPDYQVYKINIGQIVHINKQEDIERKFFDKWTSPYFLVAVKYSPTDGAKIKFISGQFFINEIKDDFLFNVKEPNSYIEFLRYKMFKYQFRSMVYFRKKKEKFFFKGYSDYLSKEVVICMDTHSVENPVLKVL